MFNPDKGTLEPFNSKEEAIKAREKLLAQKREVIKNVKLPNKKDYPIYFKGQPVLLMTKDGEGGTFVIKRLGRRTVRIQAIPKTLFRAMTGGK